MIGGCGLTTAARIPSEQRMEHDRELMERHRLWNLRCVGDDIGFTLVEYNRGIPTALVVYKYFAERLDRLRNHPGLKALGELRNSQGARLPLFIAKYWPENWSFLLGPQNPPAEYWMRFRFPGWSRGWRELSEREFAQMLLDLRRIDPDDRDRRKLSRLNETLPPEDWDGEPASEEASRAADRDMSDRHRVWPDNSPCVDVDFMLCEYNYKRAVALVEYKMYKGSLEKTNQATYRALSGVHALDRAQLPLLVAFYWPGDWAFRVKAVNAAAVRWIGKLDRGRDPASEWFPLTERQYVDALFDLRVESLSGIDREFTAGLNEVLPPEFAAVA